MRYLRQVASPALVALALLAAVPTLARADASGGAQAPSAPLAGGSEYGVLMRATLARRPVVSELNVPASATAGRPPRVTVQIDEHGVGTVNVRVTVTSLSTHRPAIVLAMGWIHTGRLVSAHWLRGTVLAPGSYHVSVVARDHHGGTLLRSAHASGVALLTVAPKPVTTSVSPVPTPLSPGSPLVSPAPGATAGAVFPVQGPHSFGGPENRFGAPRKGYVHQGQDVLAAEGLPVVAPLAGTIVTAAYQAGGAGYYTVEHTTDGFDFMFAHCRAHSLTVAEGQAVSPGERLCSVGQTGDATAPHLHFEIWVGGWQAPGGRPIDPLPYLQAWEAGG